MVEPEELRSALKDGANRLEQIRQNLKIDDKIARVSEIEALMSAPDFWNDQEKAQAVVTEMKSLKAVSDPVQAISDQVAENTELLEMALEMGEASEVQAVAAEVENLPAALDKLETMALFSDPHDNEPCFFSIHTGAGGSDACEWAEMLLRMYTRYFERQGWKTEEISFSPGDEAGIKGAELRVQGPFAHGSLKGEMGVHRLVRISPFSGRRETSFAAVDVVPDFQEEINIDIDENDLRIDRIHASGKGGQHVNKTASAIRLTHEPSNISVMVQTERSQHRNKDMAMKILKSRLYQRALAEREAEASNRNALKMENAWGSQIRNYVLHPYTMVKDARSAYETGNIQAVLDGDINGFVDAYLRWYVEQRK